MEIRVVMVGCGFMGKAHSNAWHRAHIYFNTKAKPVMKSICDKDERAVKAFAKLWGWERAETDFKKAVSAQDIDLVDICTPNNTHAEIAIAAAKAGKAVLCEKPLAMNLAQALKMADVVKKNKVFNAVSFNYRRVPAISLAKQIIAEGRIGRVFHVRAVYLQDWIIDPAFPLVWRLNKTVSGSGAHGDLNAHIIDMSRFLVGEISEVVGDAKIFIKERPLLDAVTSGLGAKAGRGKKGKVTVDDAVVFLARFANGAVGTFEATRFAQGRKNGNRIEINGEKGSLSFNFERMNELDFFDATESKHLQGWKTILATEPGAHPYIHAWWPAGHIIGYEHTFVNQAADIVNELASGKKTHQPDFADAARTQAVLDSVLLSAKKHAWVKVPRVYKP
ncbi:MAG TPA: Gfo/Idh/MocA family oxidoreductase [Planctomycetes bacterium]|nr:Gfo/Idh/MocA family oxidoreductase [Planctomycetota bacterium]